MRSKLALFKQINDNYSTMSSTNGKLKVICASEFKEKSKSLTREVLDWFWLCVVLTLPRFYSSFIFAKIVSRPVFVVDTLGDISKLPKLELGLWKGAGYGCKNICPSFAKDFPVLGAQMSSNDKIIKDLSKNELNSDESYDDVLDGKRVIFEQTSIILETLSNRIKNDARCGFYLGKTHYTYMLAMLFNKNLNEKIKYVVNKK